MILCITHSGDYYTIDLVMEAILKAGYQPFRFDSDCFDHRFPFGFAYKEEGGFDYLFPGYRTQWQQVQAVWNRKVWPIMPPADLDERYHPIFRQEYTTYREAFFDSLGGVPWMNPDAADRRIAGNKLLQLELAHRVSFTVPATLCSNDSKQVQTFFEDRCKGRMIAKLHGVLSVSMSGSGPSFPTTVITETELKQLPAQLPYCPMIFQEYVPKAFELRIAYVEGVCFAGKINEAGGAVDWRGKHAGQLSWSRFTLPDGVASRIDQLMRAAGLPFGVLDIIVTPEGDYVFLEINPKGEWGMLQKFLNYPIAETIVQQLIAKITK